MSAKTKSRRLFGRRVWLNKDITLRAALSGHVTLDFEPADPDGKAGWQREDRYDLAAELVISDCSRTIALDFDVYGSSAGDSNAEKRAKAETFRRFVLDFLAKYEDALDRIEAGRP
jgi:hypothetical protein